MYRFLLSPKWIGFHLLVAAGIVTMVALGFWQLRRLDERRDLNAEVTAALAVAPEPLDALIDPQSAEPIGAEAWKAIEWRLASASGEYLPDEQVVVYNRSQGGQAGELIVTPMQLGDGRVLLVLRGFAPLATDVSAPPDGLVEVTGRLRPSVAAESGAFSLADPESGALTEIRRLDIARLEPQLPGDAVPMYLELLASNPAETGPFPTPIDLPAIDDGPHLSYAVQWFIFACFVAAGWVFAVRHSVRSRRHSVTTGVAAASSPEAASSGASTTTPPES